MQFAEKCLKRMIKTAIKINLNFHKSCSHLNNIFGGLLNHSRMRKKVTDRKSNIKNSKTVAHFKAPQFAY